MGRTKGARNKNSGEVPTYSMLPIEERIFVLANLIVDRIIEDQTSGKQLLRHIEASHAATTSETA